MLLVIVIILLFSLIVTLHELGHFLAARRGGVEVEEFGIGFPPKIWGKKVGATLYTVNLLPLGGFVRLKGEDAAETGPGTFGSASYGVKAKILLAGVGMNILTAILILYALCLTGLPALGSNFEPPYLNYTYAQPKQLIVTEVVPNSPAAQVGIKRGDHLLQLNKNDLPDDQTLRLNTSINAGQTVMLKVDSHGSVRDIRVTLRPDGSKDGFLGVGTHQIYKVRYDPLSAAVAAIYITGALFLATIVGVFQLIIHIPNLIMGLFSNSVPPAAAAASGPLGIVFIMQSISVLGFTYIFLFMANIAVALAAFNVLPLPALDGGRLALITVQKFLKRKLSSDTEARIHAIGFMALIGLMVIISVYDLRKPH